LVIVSNLLQHKRVGGTGRPSKNVEIYFSIMQDFSLPWRIIVKKGMIYMDVTNNQVPVIYTNSAFFYAAQYDLNIHVGRKDIKGEHQDVANIIMSWPHAKAFLEVLTKQVGIYEKMFGKINLEPDPKIAKELQEAGEIKVINANISDDTIKKD
jgi:hypothetical protein